ncbi:MAG: hypothetical protein AB8B83_01150 [Bdellovibrionales bacterium]
MFRNSDTLRRIFWKAADYIPLERFQMAKLRRDTIIHFTALKIKNNREAMQKIATQGFYPVVGDSLFPNPPPGVPEEKTVNVMPVYLFEKKCQKFEHDDKEALERQLYLDRVTLGVDPDFNTRRKEGRSPVDVELSHLKTLYEQKGLDGVTQAFAVAFIRIFPTVAIDEDYIAAGLDPSKRVEELQHLRAEHLS